MAHTPEPRLAINPADAERIGLAQDTLAQVEGGDGKILLRADLRHGQRRGEVFAPMHWTDAFTAAGPIGRVVTGQTDPHSGQPALKSSRVTVKPVAGHFHGLLLCRTATTLPDTLHWVRIPTENGQLYQLTGLGPLPQAEGLTDLLHRLIPPASGLEWLELHDSARNVLRVAAMQEGRLHAALFLARCLAQLPPPDPIVALLGSPVPDTARLLLLSGRGATGADTGPRVCACFGVGRNAVRYAVVTHRLNSVAEIGLHLHAGTNCGSCIPELEEILRDVRVPV
jgi:assimilatory nitrate reductase catalytic subunit